MTSTSMKGEVREKLVCEWHRCNWHGYQNEALSAPNPFEEGGILQACPECRDICSLTKACDEEGCWLPYTCGTPVPDGYRMTCGFHQPQHSNAGKGEG